MACQWHCLLPVISNKYSIHACVAISACFDVIPPSEMPPADYDAFKFHQWAKRSLLSKFEVIDAMVKVKAECNKVAQMSVFHVPMTKWMRLEEFEQAQSQASSQVKHGGETLHITCRLLCDMAQLFQINIVSIVNRLCHAKHLNHHKPELKDLKNRSSHTVLHISNSIYGRYTLFNWLLV